MTEASLTTCRPTDATVETDADADAVLEALLGEIRRIERAGRELAASTALGRRAARDAGPRAADAPTERGGVPETVAGPDDPVRLLARSPDWACLPEAGLRAFLREAEPRRFRAGDRIIAQGTAADSVFLLLAGLAEVNVADGDDRTHPLSRVGRGDVLGELAALTGRPRFANVDALSPVRALEISADAAYRAAREFPVLDAVLRGVAGRRLGDRRRDVLAGQSLGGYRVEERLGRGGMGVVYKAVSARDGRPVALKMLRHGLAVDAEAVARFRREAAVAASLDHPGVVRVRGDFAAIGTLFLVMDFVDGETLAERLAAEGAFPQPRARDVLGQLAGVLAYAHAKGVFHRDLTPANVLVDRAGRVRLTDFGLSRCAAAAGLSAAGRVAGTPRYMAPEQLAGGEADARTDLFAFGCLAFELLSGRPAFEGRTFAEVAARQRSWSPPGPDDIRPGLAGDLYAVLRDSLDLVPERRRLDLTALARRAAAASRPAGSSPDRSPDARPSPPTDARPPPPDRRAERRITAAASRPTAGTAGPTPPQERL